MAAVLWFSGAEALLQQVTRFMWGGGADSSTVSGLLWEEVAVGENLQESGNTFPPRLINSCRSYSNVVRVYVVPLYSLYFRVTYMFTLMSCDFSAVGMTQWENLSIQWDLSISSWYSSVTNSSQIKDQWFRLSIDSAMQAVNSCRAKG